MVSQMEQAASMIFIWSDENMLIVEALTNKQNDRVYVRSSRDLSVNVRSHFRSQKPVRVEFGSVVASEEGKSPLVSSDEGVKVNSQFRLNILKEKVEHVEKNSQLSLWVCNIATIFTFRATSPLLLL